VATRDEKRDAVIRTHQNRMDAERKRKADAAAGQEERAKKLREDRQVWAANAIPTIGAGAGASADAFARRGSPYVILSGPDVSPDSVTYKVCPSGRPSHIEASFTFELRDGYVYPESTARGCDKFPGAVLVGDVTRDWVEDVADSVMTAVLGGHQMSIPD
jgi:hypothetical protein